VKRLKIEQTQLRGNHKRNEENQQMKSFKNCRGSRQKWNERWFLIKVSMED